ncbi:fas apoptotic inhibitory molecule 1-like [Ostrea edulis]|uniref:fas apoptotic inhibitory molecule 1-like n=1 Tax=Ostrea edulis TaxID=37623 RepID=UPI0024AE8A0B|nr:fas apoptotic inhibitory molecule 1-like [Ostrea edulis]
MSVILTAGKRNIANRDLSKKKKVIRKAGHLSTDGVPKLTTGWEIEIDSKEFKISFSRDNFHVWIDGQPVETTSYISDEGYDIDMFFEIEGHKGQIFSDVDNDRDEMVNYLLINDKCVAKCDQQAH